MTYEEALSLAREGDERGYDFLYQNTYREKYYLALKYMKNEQDAEDVMQMAYIKAFEKLDTLEKADAFPGWFGTIVANTAKNELVKKNPVLFSDLAVDEEGESFELEVEDENPENQPELSYTRQETVELVREMIGALSEEQKMCVLMFYIEGQSIRDIAEAMGCSENTVKSRLNYARKNLKLQGEELEKKGYKLYSVAPTTLLLLLLREEESLMAANGELELPDSVLQEGYAQNIQTTEEIAAQEAATQTGEAGSQTAGEITVQEEAAAQVAEEGNQAAIAQTAGETAAKGILQTVGGKIALGACVCLLGAGAAVGIRSMNADQPEETVIEETVEETGAEISEETAQEQEMTEAEAEEAFAEDTANAGESEEEAADTEEEFADDLVWVSDLREMLLALDFDSVKEIMAEEDFLEKCAPYEYTDWPLQRSYATAYKLPLEDGTCGVGVMVEEDPYTIYLFVSNGFDDIDDGFYCLGYGDIYIGWDITNGGYFTFDGVSLKCDESITWLHDYTLTSPDEGMVLW